ncbi:MAG: DUF3471 domain-containing protein, partial [Planctomycetota bacterium]
EAEFGTLRIHLQTDRPKARGWNEIDAVEILGPDLRQFAVRATASSRYGANGGEPAAAAVDLPSQAELRSYVGRYDFRKYNQGVMVVRLSNNRLTVQLPDQPEFALTPESRTEFRANGAPARISFELDSEGRTIALVLEQSGGTARAPKL